MIRSLILSIVLLIASVPTFAQTANTPNPCANIADATRNLSYQQTETLLASCRQAAPTVVEKLADPVQANKWSEAAKGFAQALGIAAKELGLAANDFLDSPAGYLLAAILLFNYAGGAIIGLPFTIFSMCFWWYIVRRITIKKIEYENVPLFWGALTMRRKKAVDFDFDYISEYSLIAAIALGLLNVVVWMNVT